MMPHNRRAMNDFIIVLVAFIILFTLLGQGFALTALFGS
jgi:NhaP-type Na+/H+ or K+/H+ antiporter